MADDDYDEQEDGQDRKHTDSEWAQLRREKKAREKAEAELAALKRQTMFQQAGLDMSDPRTSYFVKGYDGEDDVEAIKKAAVEAGFLSVEPEPEPDMSGVESGGRVASASQGASDAGGAVTLDDAARALQEGGIDALNEYLKGAGAVVLDVQ